MSSFLAANNILSMDNKNTCFRDSLIILTKWWKRTHQFPAVSICIVTYSDQKSFIFLFMPWKNGALFNSYCNRFITWFSASNRWLQCLIITIQTSETTLNTELPYKVSTLTLTGLEKLIMMRAGCLWRITHSNLIGNSPKNW